MQAILQRLVTEALEKKIFSGAQILLGDHQKILFQESYGRTTFAPDAKKLTTNSIFDLASLTKALATSLAVLLLVEKQELSLTTPVGKFFAEFKTPPKNQITILHLLTHTSGLPDWLPLFKQKNTSTAWQKLLCTPLQHAVGSKVVYSCLGFIILAKIIEKLTGDFQTFCKKKFYQPLELSRTYFYPFDCQKLQIVSNHKEQEQEYKATVQDDNAQIFGGNSGNSGLFSCAADIYLLAKTLLQNKESTGIALLQAASITRMWTKSTLAKEPSWGLGWVYFKGEQDYCHCSQNMEIGTVGHLGYAGTSLMIEPSRKRIYIILTNRVGSKKTVIPMKIFRKKIHRCLANYL